MPTDPNRIGNISVKAFRKEVTVPDDTNADEQFFYDLCIELVWLTQDYYHPTLFMELTGCYTDEQLSGASRYLRTVAGVTDVTYLKEDRGWRFELQFGDGGSDQQSLVDRASFAQTLQPTYVATVGVTASIERDRIGVHIGTIVRLFPDGKHSMFAYPSEQELSGVNNVLRQRVDSERGIVAVSLRNPHRSKIDAIVAELVQLLRLRPERGGVHVSDSRWENDLLPYFDCKEPTGTDV